MASGLKRSAAAMSGGAAAVIPIDVEDEDGDGPEVLTADEMPIFALPETKPEDVLAKFPELGSDEGDADSGGDDDS